MSALRDMSVVDVKAELERMQRMRELQSPKSGGLLDGILEPSQGAPMMQPPIPAPAMQQPPAPKQGFMDRVKGFTQDETKMARLASAFNQMRMNPSAAIDQRASDLMAMQAARKQSNQTVGYLRSQGRDDLADIVEANPSMAAEVLKGLATSKAGGFMRKTVGGVQVDQETGQMFTVEQDPNTGTISRTDIPGAFGPTEADKQAAALELAGKTFNVNKGFELGNELFGKFTLVDKNINDLYRVGALVDEGAITGFLNKFLPATDSATAELREITKGMGIDVIKSVTFGALSEKEMQLATEVAFPPNLKGKALAEYVQNKIRAQEKLRDALMPEVQMLLGGSGLKAYSDYKIKNVKRHQAAARAFERMQKSSPELTREMWKSMNLEAREAYIAAEDAKK